ncbi:iron ABC transporter substrate-binding protein [Prauserella muralis]|uniref:Iron ABC transporter substrate-binding protein n=1 Tax=Prauserella muralis TaxID=588067 RepID=A0A2V4B379_9PSEU|nr:iron ABC transporter substrate-binding protein [Prauserella muralis]PXY27605.1 iron ABC transporter substrate-binding protein [Prauserella muralis]TWE22665.1 iron(III) transport system substrate-binding protein [Prauserella muralis]
MLFRHRAGIGALVAALVLPLAACGGDQAGADTLVVYSGRHEGLVGGLLERLEKETGMPVEVRYGGSAEMAAQILEEGDGSQADVFFSQDAGALGALGEQGRLAKLPQDVLDAVPAKYRADDGTWVATSARARVVAYDPAQVSQNELPQGADDVLDPKWRGKVGFAPTNASWQASVTGLRVLRGEDGARDWLTRFAANDPQRYKNNLAVLDAVDSGQIALGLINHYYWYERVAEQGDDAVNARLHFVGGDDPLALVNVAGAGVLAGNDSHDAAVKAVRFLLSEQAQRYFADETAEYPVTPGVSSTKHDLPPLREIQSPDLDLSSLSSLQQTLGLLQEVGLS